MNQPAYAHTSAEHSMQDCIEACNQCHQACLQTAMNHCLKAGGKHVETEHFRLMLNCAEICQTSANFQLSSSSFHPLVCEACAESCKKMGGMDECVEACLNCAESCRKMATTQH